MRAKEYLLQLKKLDTLIDNKQSVLEDLKSRIICRTAGFDERVQATPDPQATEKQILSVIALEHELKEDIDRYVNKKREIIEMIDKLESSCEIDVVYKKYVQYMSWEEIAVELDYTFRWTLKIHARALKNMDKILNRTQKDTKVT